MCVCFFLCRKQFLRRLSVFCALAWRLDCCKLQLWWPPNDDGKRRKINDQQSAETVCCCYKICTFRMKETRREWKTAPVKRRYFITKMHLKFCTLVYNNLPSNLPCALACTREIAKISSKLDCKKGDERETKLQRSQKKC